MVFEVSRQVLVLPHVPAFENLQTILSLHNSEFARNDALENLSGKVNELSNELKSQIDKSQVKLQVANDEIIELRKIIESLTSDKLKVTLFVSSKDIDKGYIIL